MVSVLLVSRIFAPEKAAAAFRLQGLSRALANAGARVRVLTVTPNAADAAAAQPDAVAHTGYEVERHPVLRDAQGYVRGYLQYMSFDVPLAWRLLRAERPDAVVVEPPPTTGAVARTICDLRKIPYVYYAADVWSDAAASTGAPAFVVAGVRLLESYAFRGARRVIAVSDGVAERVRALGGREVAVVPNGVNTEIFRPLTGEEVPETVRQARAQTVGEAPYFVYAGTASEWQGAEIFVQALARVLETVPDVQLVFLGQGSAWESIGQLAEELAPGQVQMLGQVGQEEAAAWLSGAVASVVSIKPGLGYDFAYPTKIFSSLACGTPVIYAGPGPAVADIRAAELGWACEYTPEAVAAAMQKALSERAKLTAGESLRRWVIAHRSLQAASQAAATAVLQP